MSDPTTRLCQTTLKMDFHSDQLPVDVVGLFCQRKAKKGRRKLPSVSANNS